MSTKQETKNGIELEIVDVIQLNTELILLQKEDLDFLLKFELAKLYEETRTLARLYEDTKTKLIKKYGKKIKNKDGETQWTLAGSRDEDKALEELQALQRKKEVISGHGFKIEQFKELKSDQVYLQIMKFLQ